MTNGPRTGKMNKPVKNNRPGSAVARKIVSRTGASITFALLLFLVCAVVGTVVLVAGTSAAGRLSDVAKYDQRYYSVTSAAELLAKKLNNYEVCIKQFEVIEGNIVVETDPVTHVVTSRKMDYDPPAYSAKIGASDKLNVNDEYEEKNIVFGDSLLRDQAIYLVFGLDGNDYFSYGKSYPALTADQTMPLTITADGLVVDGVLTMNPSGNITIKLSNNTANASEKYDLTLKLKANVRCGKTSDTVTENPGTDTEKKTITTTKTTTITWTVEDIY